MKFKLNNIQKVSEWIEIFKFIKNINKHITFMAKKDELYIQMMDSSHVCLVEIKFPSSWFQEYESIDEVISCSSAVLVKIFSLYTTDTMIEIASTEDKLEIHLLNVVQNKHFEIPLLDIDQDLLSPSITDSLMDFSIKSKVFDKYLQEILLFGEDIKIESKDEKIFLHSANDDGKIQIEIEGDNLEEFNVVEDFVFTASYPLRYLLLVSKLALVYQQVHLFMDDQSPMRITFKSDVNINFFLAPKITE
jgi:DNA polymerase III sliding clamp (beta) subunit (PCNA family)